MCPGEEVTIAAMNLNKSKIMIATSTPKAFHLKYIAMLSKHQFLISQAIFTILQIEKIENKSGYLHYIFGYREKYNLHGV